MGVEQYDRYYLKLPHMKLLNMRSSSIFVRIKCRQSLTYFDIIKSTAKNKFIQLTSILKTSLFQVEIRNREPILELGVRYLEWPPGTIKPETNPSEVYRSFEDRSLRSTIVDRKRSVPLIQRSYFSQFRKTRIVYFTVSSI